MPRLIRRRWWLFHKRTREKRQGMRIAAATLALFVRFAVNMVFQAASRSVRKDG